MKKITTLIWMSLATAFALTALTSCSDDDKTSYDDPEILSIVFEGNPLVATQPALSEDGKEFVFYMHPQTTDDDLKTMVPTITSSEETTVLPRSGRVQDFSNGAVVYTATHNISGIDRKYDVRAVRNKYAGALITSITIAEDDLLAEEVVVPEDGNEILIRLAYKTPEAALESITPIITISDGAKIDPESEVAQDFSEGPIKYTVTSEEGQENEYLISVEIEKNTEARILSLWFEETNLVPSPVVILDDTYELFAYVPHGTQPEELTELTVKITVSDDAEVNPSNGDKVDFSNGPVDFVVTAQDGSTQTYTVATVVLPELTIDGVTVDSELFENVVIQGQNITFFVKPETTPQNIAGGFAPVFELPEGVVISPESGSIQDFTQPVTYTLTAGEGSDEEVVYTVTCVRNKYQGAELISVAFPQGSLFQSPSVIAPQAQLDYIFNADVDESAITSLKFVDIFTLSPGAIFTVENETVTALGDVIEVTVTSEDENNTNTYLLNLQKLRVISYLFNEWEQRGSAGNILLPDTRRMDPVGWQTTNTGVASMKLLWRSAPWSSFQVTGHDGKENEAVSITSLYVTNKTLKSAGTPEITAGSLYKGGFETDFNSPLRSSKFGEVVDYRPMYVKGWYKYTPGPTYYYISEWKDKIANHVWSVDENKVDRGTLSAVFYEIDDESESLTGEDVDTSDKIVAYSRVLVDETTDWTQFSFDMEMREGKTYDPSKKYKFTVLFSSSYDGNNFAGATSTLYIDDVEIYVY